MEKEKKKRKVNKTHLIKLLPVLIILCILLIGLGIYILLSIKQYDKKILPGIYIGNIEMSKNSYESAKTTLEANNYDTLSQEMIFIINGNEYKYSLADLGTTIDYDKTLDSIKKYQKGLSYGEKNRIIHKKEKKVFNFVYTINNERLTQILNELKETTHVDAVNGYFDTSEGIHYVKGIAGYTLNPESSIELIDKFFAESPKEFKIELVGDSITPEGNDSYASIDTLTSSAVTPFVPNTYQRNINLNTALRYINGTVIEPGEVFSYCDIAGPFNKQGYVFYYEFVGNGVCQIATTTYNAALTGGLEIVKRYPHKKKSLYIAGGLDATVASYGSGWCVDMQFKNTYNYPIYIRAYSEGARAHVEFWSNSNAKEGYEYTTESVQIGQRGYRTYLHKWKDGVEVEKNEIATTWYSED